MPRSVIGQTNLRGARMASAALSVLFLIKCLSGAQLAPPTFGCRCADLDHQNDVDQADFDLFQICLSGPGVQPGPECGV